MTGAEFLAREIGNKTTAENMVSLATFIGDICVVTRTQNGAEVGVRYDKSTGSLMTGFGLATGSREFES